MIVARMNNEEGNEGILFLLEPGNLAKLELGQPIVKKIKQFIPELEKEIEIVIGYSPDIQYIAEQVNKGVSFEKALEASFNRKPVFVRSDKCETLQKVL